MIIRYLKLTKPYTKTTKTRFLYKNEALLWSQLEEATTAAIIKLVANYYIVRFWLLLLINWSWIILFAHINVTIFSYLGVSRRQVRWWIVYLQRETTRISGGRERFRINKTQHTLTSGPVGAERGWVGWSVSVGWCGLPPAGSWSYCNFNHTQMTLIRVAQSHSDTSSFSRASMFTSSISAGSSSAAALGSGRFFSLELFAAQQFFRQQLRKRKAKAPPP